VKWILLGAVVTAVLAWLATRTPGGKGRRRRMGSAALRRRLRKLTHDPDVAARLVRAEATRHPDLDEADVLRRVIRRLERDRRR